MNNTFIYRLGRISVFGDSTCFDSASKHTGMDCLFLMKDILEYSFESKMSPHYSKHTPIIADYVSKRLNRPKRMPGNSLRKFSHVLGRYLPTCQEKEFNILNFSEPPIDVNWKVAY
jgi:hypothetical protein